jgi:hypothetical protein
LLHGDYQPGEHWRTIKCLINFYFLQDHQVLNSNSGGIMSKTNLDEWMSYTKRIADLQVHEKVLIKGKERKWEFTKQAKLKYYLNPATLKDNPLHEWYVIANEIHTHTGSHVHQGGILIFVLEGRGYTLIDGERWDWEAGDLILLPIKAGGVEHQHFNLDSEKPCKWLAMLYTPYRFAANPVEVTQKIVSPLYPSDK